MKRNQDSNHDARVLQQQMSSIVSQRPSSARSTSSHRGTRQASKSPSINKRQSRTQEGQQLQRQSRPVSPYYSRIDKVGAIPAPASVNQYKEIYVSDKDYKLLQHAFSSQNRMLKTAADSFPPLRSFKKTYIGYVTVPDKSDASSEVNAVSKSKSMVARRGSALPESRSIPSRNSRSLSPKHLSRKKQSIRIVLPDNYRDESQGQGSHRASMKHKSVEGSVSCSTSCDYLYDIMPKSSTKLPGPGHISSGNCNKDKFSQVTVPENLRPVLQDKSIHCYFPPKKIQSSGDQLIRTLTGNDGSKKVEKTSPSDNDQDKALGFLKLPSESRLSLLGNLALISRTKAFKETLVNASEAIVILMNAIFRESLADSEASKILARSDLFKRFLNEETRADALHRAGHIFRTASDYVNEFATAVAQTSSSRDCDNNKSLRNAVSGPLSEDQVPVTRKESVDAGNQIGQSASALLVTNSTETAPIHPPKFQVTVTTTPTPGFVHETITGNDSEIKLTFLGTPQRISSLIAATRSKSKSVLLSPVQTVETIHRSFSFIAGRLTVVKFHMQHTSQQLGVVVQEYTEGKHGHYSKSLKRSTLKLQGLNTFSGIVVQISRAFLTIFKRLLPGMAVWARLREIFRLQIDQYRLEISVAKMNSHAYDTRSKSQDGQIIDELTQLLDDVDALVDLGNNSLASVSTNAVFPGVKIKKSLRDILDRLTQAIEQMGVKQDVDLGSLVLAATCSALLLGATELEEVPMLDSWMLQSILTNLEKIEAIVNEIHNIAGRLNFVASYLASKSLNNIKSNKETAKVMADKKMLLRRIPWYKRRMMHHTIPRSYSTQSVRTVGENGDAEFQGVADVQSENGEMVSSQMSISNKSGDHAGNAGDESMKMMYYDKV